MFWEDSMDVAMVYYCVWEWWKYNVKLLVGK